MRVGRRTAQPVRLTQNCEMLQCPRSVGLSSGINKEMRPHVRDVQAWSHYEATLFHRMAQGDPLTFLTLEAGVARTQGPGARDSIRTFVVGCCHFLAEYGVPRRLAPLFMDLRSGFGKVPTFDFRLLTLDFFLFGSGSAGLGDRRSSSSLIPGPWSLVPVFRGARTPRTAVHFEGARKTWCPSCRSRRASFF